MSNDDDNALQDLDLSAWDAPAAPAGLADAVIARLGASEAPAEAHAVAAATEIERHRSRRAWVFAGVAIAAAAGVWLVLHVQREPQPQPPASGVMLADRARHVDLDKVSADLDLGADVRWRKTPAGLRIEQHAGAATWRVASGEHVVIDAGAGSGAAASIDATGASLRVEIQPMNMSDARVIGASALTSAAVAIITVVVYEGHVKATSAGQTVVVQPGSTVEIRPDQPPKEPLHIGLAPPDPGPVTGAADLAIEAGQSVTIHDPDGSASVQIHGPCTATTSIALGAIPTVRVQPDGVLTVPVGQHRYELRCDGSPTLVAAGTIEVVRDAGTRDLSSTPTMSTIDADGRTYTIRSQSIPAIRVRVPGAASTYTLIIDHDGVVAQRRTSTADAGTHPTSMTFLLDRGILVPTTYTLRFELDGQPKPTSTTLEIMSDPTAPIAVIDEPVQGATWSSPVHLAGQTIEGSVVTASGRGIIVDDHHRFAGDLTLGSTVLAIRVVHPERGVHYYIRRAGSKDLTVGKACDAAALRDQGSQSAANGDHARALEIFEEAYRCKPDLHAIELAFMAACNTPNRSKAEHYYSLLTADQRTKVVLMCVRNGIMKDQLDAAVAAPVAFDFSSTPADAGILRIDSTPVAHIYIDGKDTKLSTPITGDQLKLVPGHHKVTFAIDGNRYTYPVTIEAKKTVTLSKDFR